MSKKILVVEDEQPIRELITFYVKKEGYTILLASDGSSALAILDREQVDMVILDLMLPKVDGIEVCKYIRSKYGYSVYVLMLTAKGEEIDRILGLEMGADDYMVKPFSPRELVVRIKAAFRRDKEAHAKDVLKGAGIVLDRRQYSCTYRGINLELTPRQFALLAYLLENQNKVCTREELLNAVWGFDYYGDTRTVDVHISQIRQRLCDVSGEEIVPIETLRGVGYRLRGGE